MHYCPCHNTACTFSMASSLYPPVGPPCRSCCCYCWCCVVFSKRDGSLSEEALARPPLKSVLFCSAPCQNELEEKRLKIRQLNEQLQDKSPLGAGARAAVAQSAMKLRAKQAESVRKLERETTRYASPWRHGLVFDLAVVWF